jgi:hypothetical protein
MRGKLNWKGNDETRYWSALASRAVGGRYSISKYGGPGFYAEVSYRVEHRTSADLKAGNTGHGLDTTAHTA